MRNEVSNWRGLFSGIAVSVGIFLLVGACFLPRQPEDRLLVPRTEGLRASAPMVPTEDIALIDEIRARTMPFGEGMQELSDRAERAKQVVLAEEELRAQLSERLSEGVSIPTGVEGKVEGVDSAVSAGTAVRDISEYEKLVAEMYDWLGVKYVWGGTTKKGADCSGFVQSVYRAIGYSDVPRVSRDQSKHGLLVDRKSLMLGDLLFFDTRNARNHGDIKTPSEEMQNAVDIELGEAPNVVSHVGVYIGNGVMLHASSGDGYITFANLESNYYKTRFINARRIIGETQD